MKMRTTHILLFISALTLSMHTACRREVEEQPTFPDADFYSPTTAQEGDTISVMGTGLDGSTVSFGGSTMTLVSETSGMLQFVVPVGASNGAIKVNYPDGDSFEFIENLKIDASTGRPQMLIGDFDLGGIRPAEATEDFLNGQWEMNAAGAAATGIASSINGVESSPAGGNFAYAAIDASGILPNTFGFVASLGNRAEIQNDGQSAWPTHFGAYPNAPFDMSGAPSTYYLNFYINHNGLDHGQVRIYLVNPDVAQGERFAFTVSWSAAQTTPEWEWKSIALSNFRDNFGFGSGISTTELQEFNRIEFSISDDHNNEYSSCCTGTTVDCCDEAIVDPVQVYIDHVVLSEGGPLPAPTE